MSLEVRYVPGTTTGHIVLTGTNQPPVRKATSDFFVIGDTHPVGLNRDDKVFKRENEKLRILDMLKDSHQKPAIPKETFQSVFNEIEDDRGPMIHAIRFEKLHEYENKIETYFLNNRMQIKSHSWIKDKSTLLPPSEQYKIDHGFYESGAEFNWFAKIGNHMQNFGNRVVDNAKRPSGMIESLPYTISIDESVFRFFGLPGCSVSSTYRKHTNPYPKYKMNIKCPGIPLTARTAIKDQSITEKDGDRWFLGNNAKNKIIIGNRSSIQSYVLLHTKEMGDFLQVLYMFMWVLLNKNKTYAMTTGDKVVWITCMILSLNSFFAFVEKDKKGVKMRSIKYFQGKEYTIQDARDNFEKEKTKLIKDASLFLESMEHLQKNSNISIYIQGNSLVFPSDFYDKICKDVGSILTELDEYVLPAVYNTPNLIDNHTQELKWNFSILFFIRGVNRQFKMSHSIKKYTARNNLWSPDLVEKMHMEQLPYGKLSFYEVGLLFNRRTYGGNNIIKGGNPRGLIIEDPEDFKCYLNVYLSYNYNLYINEDNEEELFPNTDYTITSDQIDAVIRSDKEYNIMESNEKYNYLIGWLLFDIYLCSTNRSISENIGDFDMITSVLFHWFELKNEVFYLESERMGLNEVFHSILQHDIITGRRSQGQCNDFVNQHITGMIQEPQSMQNHETKTPRSISILRKKPQKKATLKKLSSPLYKKIYNKFTKQFSEGKSKSYSKIKSNRRNTYKKRPIDTYSHS
jgi:hypothetical protein